MRWGEEDKITKDKEEIFMDIGSAFPSKYLKAADLKGKHVTVQISGLEMEDIGDKTGDKPVLYFANKSKGLVLNKTNTTTIIENLGTSETDDWMGQRITLFTTRVDFQGRRVDAIRIDQAPNRKKASPVEEQEGFLADDMEKPYEGDDAPF